jgi:hypothetical protein
VACAPEGNLMEHFIACESGDRPRTSLEATGRLRVSSRNHGQLLEALNGRLWLVRRARAKGQPRLELQGTCVAAAIGEAGSGEFVFDGVDAIDFEPPVILSDCSWFDRNDAWWSKLRTGIVRIPGKAIVDHLLEIEHRERTARGRRLTALPARGAAGSTSREAVVQRELSRAHLEKAAVQQRALASAIEYYGFRWKNVEDVSGHEAYELRCDDPKGRTLAVSVKGTSGSWENLLLTAAEERHAREKYPDVALFILHGVEVGVGPDGELVGRGGTTHVIDPWDISIDELSPLIFGCRVARTRTVKHGSR